MRTKLREVIMFMAPVYSVAAFILYLIEKEVSYLKGIPFILGIGLIALIVCIVKEKK